MTYRIAAFFAVSLATGCASVPTLNEVPAYRPVLTKTAAAQQIAVPEPEEQTASLWGTTANTLLSMRRAKEVGDLLTVVVEMNDQASLQNSLTRSRNSSDDMNVNALLGLPEWANGVLPGGATLSPGVDINRNSALNGSGAVNRAEKITFQLASRVVAVEANGNLVIEGYQETRVSNEIRYLTVSGVIRAQDITRTNTVTYEKIADAQLAYVSEGIATGGVKRAAIPTLIDKYSPF